MVAAALLVAAGFVWARGGPLLADRSVDASTLLPQFARRADAQDRLSSDDLSGLRVDPSTTRFLTETSTGRALRRRRVRRRAVRGDRPARRAVRAHLRAAHADRTGRRGRDPARRRVDGTRPGRRERLARGGPRRLRERLTTHRAAQARTERRGADDRARAREHDVLEHVLSPSGSARPAGNSSLVEEHERRHDADQRPARITRPVRRNRPVTSVRPMTVSMTAVSSSAAVGPTSPKSARRSSLGQLRRRAHAGEELQDAEAEEHEPEADPQRRDRVPGQHRREAGRPARSTTGATGSGAGRGDETGCRDVLAAGRAPASGWRRWTWTCLSGRDPGSGAGAGGLRRDVATGR